MIAVDASAVLAIYFNEPERAAFLTRISGVRAFMSPVNLWEVLVRAQAVDGEAGRGAAEQLIAGLGIEIVTIDSDTARASADAYARFGKRSSGGLNLGDCFAYALAKARGLPLLFKGNDFSKTDIAPA